MIPGSRFSSSSNSGSRRSVGTKDTVPIGSSGLVGAWVALRVATEAGHRVQACHEEPANRLLGGCLGFTGGRNAPGRAAARNARLVDGVEGELAGAGLLLLHGVFGRCRLDGRLVLRE